jgi:hypothetical protein
MCDDSQPRGRTIVPATSFKCTGVASRVSPMHAAQAVCLIVFVKAWSTFEVSIPYPYKSLCSQWPHETLSPLTNFRSDKAYMSRVLLHTTAFAKVGPLEPRDMCSFSSVVEGTRSRSPNKYF